MFKKSKLLGKLGLGSDKKSSDSAPVDDDTSDEASGRGLHQDAHDEGGLSCTNDELIRVQQRAITKWITSMGQRLLTGNINLINTPFPVDIFEPRSYLEKLADVWVHPRYLQLAAAATSPVDRMKLVITWFISGLQHLFATWRKPFNPILGETWQASLSDGSCIFMEQISHHPPVSSFHIEGPGSSYRFVGLSQPKVSVMLKHWGFQTVAKGMRYVEFADGTKIDIVYPAYCIKGVVYSSRPKADVEGKAIFTDAKNCLKAVVRFGGHKGAKGVLKRSDAVMGEVYDTRRAKVQPQEPLPPPVEPHAASSLHNQQSINSSLHDEDFESASETDWELRDGEPDAGGLEAGALEALQLAPPELQSCPDELDPSAGRAVSALQAPEDRARASDDGARSSHSVLNGSGGSMFNRMTGFLGFASSPSVSDEVEGIVVSRCEGSWLSHIDFDRKRYWTLVSEAPDAWVPDANPLPSDSRFRQDLAALAAGGELKAAQTWKEKLEHIQRHDKKLREQ